MMPQKNLVDESVAGTSDEFDCLSEADIQWYREAIAAGFESGERDGWIPWEEITGPAATARRMAMLHQST